MPYTSAAKNHGPRFTGEDVIEPFDFEAWRREVQEVFSRPRAPLPPVKPGNDEDIYTDPDLSIDPDCVGYEDENWEHRTHFGRP